jgi:hypothetical protein
VNFASEATVEPGRSQEKREEPALINQKCDQARNCRKIRTDARNTDI